MAQQYLGGQAQVSLNGLTIPATLLSEVSVELTEGTRETATLGGTFTQPTGVFETAQAMFTLFLPTMDYLKTIFPAKFNAPTAPQLTGNLIFGGGSCVTQAGTPVNIHFTCDDSDNNDVYFYNGLVQMNFNPTYSTGDSISVEIMVLAQPAANGNIVRLGTGNLVAKSIYNATTMTTTTVV